MENQDLLKFVMCTLVSRDSVPFFKYIKRHVYSGNQGTHDKLNQIQLFKLEPKSKQEQIKYSPKKVP